MRAALAAASLIACQGPPATGEDGPRGTLGVAVRADEVPDWLATLSIRVEQVVVDGYGPDGAASFSAEVGAGFALDDEPRAEPIAVFLPAGTWDPVRVTLHLSSRDGAAALAATGAGEGADFVLEVLELSVDGTGALTVPEDGAAQVSAVFHPAEWDELREVEGDDDEVVRIDVARERERYDEVVDEIARTTRFEFPEDDE